MPAPISTAVTKPSSGALSLSGYQAFSGKKKPASSGALSLGGFQSATGRNASAVAPLPKAATGTATRGAVSTSGPASLGSYNGKTIYAGQDVPTQMGLVKPAATGGPSPETPATVGGGTPPPTKRFPTPEAPKRGVISFPGIVGDLAGASRQSPVQAGLIQRTAASGDSAPAIGEKARALSEKYGAEIARVGNLGAGAEAGSLSTGTNVVGSGNAAIASQSASQRMAALAAGQEAALRGTGQQLTAQGQQAAALAQALGGANTGQSNTLSGLGSAAGLVSPSTSSYGQTVFDPATGTFGGGSAALDPQTAAAKLAQEVVAGRMTYEQAASSLGYAGGAGTQFLNTALQAVPGGYNIPQGQATLAGQTSVLGGIPQLESANTAAEGIRGKIVTYLNENPDLNPSPLAAGNAFLQYVQGKQLSDPKYQTLVNFLNEYTSTLAPILGVGGDATNFKTEIAQSFINAAASGQSIATVLDNMSALASGKIQDIRSGATGGGVVSSPSVGGAGGFAEAW